MDKQTHHIQKQQVDLDFETEEKARRWKDRFFEFYHEEILPGFNSLLDQSVPGDQFYTIERLEIDLGTIQMDDFRAAFLEKMEAELKRVLQNRHVPGSAGHPPGKGDGATRESPPRGRSDHSSSPEEERHPEVKGGTTTERLLESFIYFLDHGVLPWNSSVETVAELEAAVRREPGPGELTELAAFQKRMAGTPSRRRFYFQFSPNFTEEVFNLLYTDERLVIRALEKAIKQYLPRLAEDDSSRRKIRQAVSESFWYRIITQGPDDSREWPAYYVRSVVREHSSRLETPGETAVFRALLTELPPSSPLAAQLKRILDPEEDASTGTGDGAGGQAGSGSGSGTDTADQKKSPGEKARAEDRYENKPEGTGDREEPAPQYKNDNESFDESSPKEQEKEKGEKEGRNGSLSGEGRIPETAASAPSGESEEIDVSEQLPAGEPLEEYYLRNAGIILCWPFLETLFANLEYLGDEAFRGPDQQQRAVHLLGYLGSGEDRCEENELVLAKFLADWPLQLPIVKELELTKKEKTSAGEMLASLIGHWSALKNTSVEGLRHSFFKREGKLFQDDSRWRLLVEQKSYDMLLDRLPYSIAIIRLPWMREVLNVDWA